MMVSKIRTAKDVPAWGESLLVEVAPVEVLLS